MVERVSEILHGLWDAIRIADVGFLHLGDGIRVEWVCRAVHLDYFVDGCLLLGSLPLLVQAVDHEDMK